MSLHHESAPSLAHQKLPPIAELIMASMAFVITSGIYLAAHLPRRASLGPVVVLLALAAASLVVAIVTISRLRDFAWGVFFRVGLWALAAYIVITGILEFVFIFDHTRGSMLVVFSCSLAIFAIDIPVLLAFSVARYQEPKPQSPIAV